MRILHRSRIGAPLLVGLVVALGVACDGDGSPTAPNPVVRYVQVSGSWQGVWMAAGLVPIQVTLHLGQKGSAVTGTAWIAFEGEAAAFQLTGSAGTDNGSGTGTFSWTCSDESGRMDCAMNLASGVLTGTLTLTVDGETLVGPLTLNRAAE